ncbi:MAG: hypothetical protein ABSA81_09930 [Candidatus Bathyarchaeia archaeon]
MSEWKHERLEFRTDGELVRPRFLICAGCGDTFLNHDELRHHLHTKVRVGKSSFGRSRTSSY